jgi:hypothetical protein
MAFSDQTIGFFLQAEDRLTPVLKKAASNYDRLVASMETMNKRAYKTASGIMDQTAKVVRSFSDLPKAATVGYRKALNAVRKEVRTIVQPFTLRFSTAGRKELSESVGRAVGRALRNMRIVLTPTVPEARNPLFDTSVQLRKLYKTIPQPPDMEGYFKRIPKMAKGGVVPPGGAPPGVTAPAPDKTLIWARPGEGVVPKEIMGLLKERDISGRFLKATEIEKSVKGVAKLAAALRNLRKAVQSGFATPEMISTYSKGITTLDGKVTELKGHFAKLGDQQRLNLGPAFEYVSETVEGFADAAETARDKAKSLLKQGMNQERAQTFLLALGNIRDALRDTTGRFAEVAGKEGVESFIDNMNQANRTLSLSRSELLDLKAALADTASTQRGYVSMTDMGEAVEGLINAGARTREEFQTLGPVVALVARQTGLGVDEVSESVFDMNKWLEMSVEDTGKLFMAQRRLAKTSLVGIKDISAAVTKFRKEAGAYLAGLSPGESKKALQTVSVFTAGMGEYGTALADQLSDMAGKALGGTVEEQLTAVADMEGLFRRAGGSAQEFLSSFESGDMTAAGVQMQTLADFLNTRMDQALREGKTRAQGLSLAVAGTAFESREARESLMWLAKEAAGNPKAVAERFAKAQKAADDTGGSLDDLQKGSATVTKWIDKLKGSISTVFAKWGGAEILDFFKEMNPLLLLSLLHIGGLTKGFFGLGKIITGPIGWLFGKKGGAAAAAGPTSAVGSAVGGAGGGFLTGLAGGLKALANPMALLGIVAVTGAIIGLGFAMKLAAPFVEKIMTGVVQIVGLFKEMEPSQILASAAALLLLGPSLASIGTGVLVMSTALLASMPAIALLDTIAPAGNTLAGGSGVLARLVTGMASAFSVDPVLMQTATTNMMYGVAFVSGLALMMGAMGSLSIGATVMNGLEKLGGLFAGGGPLANLSQYADNIAATIPKLARSFAGLAGDARTRKMMESTTEYVGVLWQFLKSFLGIAGMLTVANLGATGMNTINAIANPFRSLGNLVKELFGKESNPFQTLVDMSGQMRVTLDALVSSFADVKLSESFTDTLNTIRGLADFTAEWSYIAQKMQGIAGVEAGVNIGPFITVWRKNAPLDTLAAAAGQIINTLTILTTHFGGVTKESIAPAVAGIKASMGFVDDVVSMFTRTRLAADTAKAMEGGWFTESGWNTLSDNVYRSGLTMSAIIRNVEERLAPVSAEAVAGLDSNLIFVSKLVGFLDQLDKLAAVNRGAAGVGHLAYIFNQLSNFGSIAPASTTVLPRVAAQWEGLFGAMGSAKMPEMRLSAPTLTQTPSQPIVGAEMIQLAQSLADSVTGANSPLHQEAMLTNRNLAEIVGLLKGGIAPVINVRTPTASGARPTSEATRNLAIGR